MKKIIIAIFLSMTVLASLCSPTRQAYASQATSYTYTFDQKGFWTRTQDAYLPDKTITKLGLMAPDDLFIDKENMLYIADSGNRRIVKYSINTDQVEGILEYEELMNPRGVFVTGNGDIYVTDPSAKAVFRFDRSFAFQEKFIRPETPSFADTPFEPLRIAVDNGRNMYIIGEGVYNGIIQLASTGDFLGYFAVNKAKLTLAQAIQNAIFTRAQLQNLVARVPTTFSNVFIDDDNIVYSTTMGTNTDGLKKHNTAGGNMFKDQDWVSDSMTDLYVDEQGIIYTSEHGGYINIYSPSGELIFNFGSYVFDLDVSGLYSTLPTIAVDQDGTVWTADGDKGYLQSFKPTDYARMVYGAMGLYEQGRYEEALLQWSEVLKLNQMSVLAHNGVGKAYLHAERYVEAMKHFKVSGDREFYSEAFWEVRNTWLQKKLSILAAIIVILWLCSFWIKHFDKKRLFRQWKRRVYEKLQLVPVLKDALYASRIPKHPIDLYYPIKKSRQGSVMGASILYLILFITFMAFQTSKGFIYQYQAVEDMDINAIVIGFFALIGLFILCNYLVASIKDGDGSLSQVYMIPAYGSIPVIVAMISTTLLSYVLTYNESFLLDIILYVGVFWTAITIFLGFMTVHDYSAKETVVSLIITLIFMIIAAILTIIIIIMWDQLWQFILSIGKEAARNVIN
jgi:tetratricopeptide (TPR) repeat protein